MEKTGHLYFGPTRSEPRAKGPTRAHFYWSCIYGSIASWLASIPILISSRTSLYDIKPQGTAYRFIERITNPLADSVVTISRAVQSDTVEIEGVPASKVELIYNGVEPASQSDIGDGSQLRRSLGVAPEDSIVVIVANFHLYKRHDTLLKAAQRVLRQQPNTKFLLVGRDAGQLDPLKELSRELAIDESICFTGVRSDIPDILSISDIGVLCSETEAFGNALLEYMDAGLPIVGTRVGGIPEIVIHAETGWLVSVGDDEALGRHLLDLLVDPAAAKKMGAAGRARAHTTFSLDEMVRGYSQIYASLLASKGFHSHDSK